VAEDIKAEDVHRIISANADKKSKLHTDEGREFNRVGREFAKHEAVNHSAGEYARGKGADLVTSNTVEGYFSIFKRGMVGVYQHCGEQHLHRYVTEFDFRYSNRAKLGIDDAMRTTKALEGAEGKRLTYRRAGGRQTA
jgi:hypothetical protein